MFLFIDELFALTEVILNKEKQATLLFFIKEKKKGKNISDHSPKTKKKKNGEIFFSINLLHRIKKEIDLHYFSLMT